MLSGSVPDYRWAATPWRYHWDHSTKEIRLLKTWSQAARSVAVNSLSPEWAWFRVRQLWGVLAGPVRDGGGGGRETGRRPGQWEASTGAMVPSHPPCYPGHWPWVHCLNHHPVPRVLDLVNRPDSWGLGLSVILSQAMLLNFLPGWWEGKGDKISPAGLNWLRRWGRQVATL